MKAIVTGSQGFIGRHLVAYLRAADWEVRGIDCAEGADEVRDISWAGIGETPADVLFHLAASPSRASHHEGTNAAMAKTVAYWANRNPAARVVFASSWMAGVAFCGYARSKADAERLLYYETSPRDRLVILRLPNIYGPGGAGVMDIFKRQAVQGAALTVHARGQQMREFMHVEDAVAALVQYGTTSPAADPEILVELEGEREAIIWLTAILRKADAVQFSEGPDFGPELTGRRIYGTKHSLRSYLGE